MSGWIPFCFICDQNWFAFEMSQLVAQLDSNTFHVLMDGPVSSLVCPGVRVEKAMNFSSTFSACSILPAFAQTLITSIQIKIALTNRRKQLKVQFQHSNLPVFHVRAVGVTVTSPPRHKSIIWSKIASARFHGASSIWSLECS